MADVDEGLDWCGDPAPARWGSRPAPGPVCSEPPGHDGDHIARDPFGVTLRRWRNDDRSA